MALKVIGQGDHRSQDKGSASFVPGNGEIILWRTPCPHLYCTDQPISCPFQTPQIPQSGCRNGRISPSVSQAAVVKRGPCLAPSSGNYQTKTKAACSQCSDGAWNCLCVFSNHRTKRSRMLDLKRLDELVPGQ